MSSASVAPSPLCFLFQGPPAPQTPENIFFHLPVMGSSRAHGYRLTVDDLNMTVSQRSALSTEKQTVQKLGFLFWAHDGKSSTAGLLYKGVCRAPETAKIPRAPSQLTQIFAKNQTNSPLGRELQLNAIFWNPKLN